MENKKPHIEYYCFDIDDNLTHNDTKINMINKKTGKKEAVSSEEFAKIRNDKENYEYAPDAFVEFRDDGPRGENAFIEDFTTAIKEKHFAPSWEKFIHTLVNGYLFALITARGHAPSTFKKGVEWVIDNYLTDDQKEEMYHNLLKYVKLFGEQGDADKHDRLPNLSNFSKNEIVQNYLNTSEYYGVSNPEFLAKHASGGAANPEKGKEIALKEFISKVKNFANRIGATISVGMSDDDIKNVTHVENVFKELKEIYPDTIFRLYDTSKRGYVKKVIESKGRRIKNYIDFIKETSNQGTGLESSVISSTQFGNMTGQLYPEGPIDRQDDFKNQAIRQSKYLAKTSKDIFGKRKKKK